jgi:putative hydrolases of HD superfamily
MTTERLERQLEFIVEVDKLKSVYRRSRLINRSRYENDAEHTWHLIMMAMVLSEHSNRKDLDLFRVFRMLLVHDIVEIDAGDTFAYDDAGHLDKFEREDEAAKRIFGLLPEDQAKECYALWREFEDRTTDEAQFAAAVDRLQPMLHNYHTEGSSWKENGVTSDKVLSRNKHVAEGSTTLWDYAEKMIRRAVERGYLEK